ncbi:hypothetical protein [Acetobacter sp.]|uniref:hypothetical protein n=1 Tax=Acetobacter sp. TaxID=440 RepID=UPI0039E8D065
MTLSHLTEEKMHAASDVLKKHFETLFSTHSGQLEGNLKSQIETLRNELTNHEQKRHASHVKVCLTMAAALVLSAFIHFRHHKAK